ncbi:MAG: Calx-beta domain-containing protein, partial [Planctomycetota bacterium]
MNPTSRRMFKTAGRRRRLRVESLESRRLLAAIIGQDDELIEESVQPDLADASTGATTADADWEPEFMHQDQNASGITSGSNGDAYSHASYSMPSGEYISVGSHSASAYYSSYDDYGSSDDPVWGGPGPTAPGPTAPGPTAPGPTTPAQPQATITIGNAEVTEGGTAQFQVAAENLLDSVTLYVQVEHLSTNDADVELVSQTLSFGPGNSNQTVFVGTFEDSFSEGTEYFFLAGSIAQGNAELNGPGLGAILDNEVAPCVSVTHGGNVDEGDSTYYGLSLEGSNTLDQPIFVSLQPQDLTADYGTNVSHDYTSSQSFGNFGNETIQHEIAPGQGYLTSIQFETFEDFRVEGNETFTLDINISPSLVSVCDAVPTTTIRDTTIPVGVSVRPGPVVVEGDLAVFEIVLDSSNHNGVFVTYETVNGSAYGVSAPPEEVIDFEHQLASVDFRPGHTIRTVEVETFDDRDLHADESDENFHLEILSASAGVIVRQHESTATILDNDVVPELRVSGDHVNEGMSAQPRVQLSEAVDHDVTFDFMTIDQSAISPDDYEPVLMTVTIPAGQLDVVIDIDTVVDGIQETRELFLAEISNASGARIADASGNVWIYSDDHEYTISVQGDETVEGNEGYSNPNNLNFKVTVDPPPRPGHIVRATLQQSSNNGDLPLAYFAHDYRGDQIVSAPFELEFAYGQSVQTVTFDINGDLLVESDEGFVYMLTNVAGESTTDGLVNVRILGDGRAEGRIIDDDEFPAISVGDAEVDESGTLVFPITLSKPYVRNVTGLLSTADITATAFLDYDGIQGLTSGVPFYIASGATEITIPIETYDDEIVEDTETMRLWVHDVQNANVIDDTGIGTIYDDDRAYEVSIEDDEETEGDFGYDDPRQIEFPVHVTPALEAGDTLFVEYDVYELDIEADFRALTPADWRHNRNTDPANIATAHTGIIRFDPGDSAAQVLVDINGDRLVEHDELFGASIRNAWIETANDGSTRVDVTRADAEGTIRNDDAYPTISISDDTVFEGEDLRFIITLSEPYVESITGIVQTYDQSAVSPDDYDHTRTVSSGGSPLFFEFLPGETSLTLDVSTVNDLILESTEDMRIEISDVENAQIGKGSGVGTILDDEREYVLRIEGDRTVEGNAFYVDPEVLEFEVSVSPSPSDGDVITADWMLRELSDDELVNLFGSIEEGRRFQALYVPDWLYAVEGDDTELVYVDGYPPTGTYTFDENSPASQPILAPVNGDWIVEEDEYMAGLLTGYSAVSGTAGRGITLTVEKDFDYGVIEDDDDPVDFDFERLYDGKLNCECCYCGSAGTSVRTNAMEGNARVAPGGVPGSSYRTTPQYDATQVETFKVEIAPGSRPINWFEFTQTTAGRETPTVTVDPTSLTEFAFSTTADLDRQLPTYHGSAVYLSEYEFTAVVETGFEPLKVSKTKELAFPIVDDRDAPGGIGWRPDEMMQLIPVIPASGVAPASLMDSDGLG